MSVMRSNLLLGALLVVAPALLAPSLPVPAAAQQAALPKTDSAVAPISALYQALTTMENSGEQTSFDQRVQALAPVVDRTFNLPVVLKTSVGPRYDSIPPDQRQQLLQVFRQFTIARYVSNFAPDTGDTLTVAPVSRPSPYGSDQIVQTQIVSSSNAVTKVDYVMRKSPQGWQVVDVLLGGNISQVTVQRSDFGSAVSTGDATPLIESLRKKIQSLSET